MKLLFVLCLLIISTILVFTNGHAIEKRHERGCIYILGQCVKECEEGTHAYVTPCASPSWSERTCANPEPQDLGAICDLSRCDCDEPTVRDQTTNKCVKLEDCPKTT